MGQSFANLYIRNEKAIRGFCKHVLVKYNYGFFFRHIGVDLDCSGRIRGSCLDGAVRAVANATACRSDAVHSTLYRCDGGGKCCLASYVVLILKINCRSKTPDKGLERPMNKIFLSAVSQYWSGKHLDPCFCCIFSL